MAELPRNFGTYVLLEQLGSGGMGTIYLAREREGSTPLVIKQLHAQLAEDPIFVQRFQHEAQLAKVVDSPNLVKVFDIGRIEDIFFIVMEYIAGWALVKIIASLRKNEKPPPIYAAADVICDVLGGLSALHEAKDQAGTPLGILHRDIAPKNIMVGENGRARLIDLGIGRSSIADFATRTGIVLGSPGYMSPEQVLGQTIDQRTDVYATGVVLFELLTLERYVTHGPVAQMLRECARPKVRPPLNERAELPPALDQIVVRALAPDPGERYASAELFRRALLPYAAGSPDEHLKTLVDASLQQELKDAKTHAATTLRDPARASRKRRVPKDVVALAAFAAVAGAVAISSIAIDPTEQPAPVRELPAEPPQAPQAPRVEPAKPRSFELPVEVAKEPARPPQPRTKKLQPKRAEPEPEPEPAPPAEPVKTREAVIAEANALAERALRLRKRHPPGTAEQARIDKIIAEVTQMSTLPAPESEAKKVAILERALNDLEPN